MDIARLIFNVIIDRLYYVIMEAWLTTACGGAPLKAVGGKK